MAYADDSGEKWPRRIKSIPGVLLLLVLLALTGRCAPDPRTVRCNNDRECAQRGGDFHYCARGRCVECVTNSACGPRGRCANGVCES